jgi:hypothetical protein
MGLRDRRYFVLEVSDRVLQDTVYFGQLCGSFTDEMKKHLLNFYLRFNTEGFNPFIPPMTALKEEIQASQLHPTEPWVKQWKCPEDACFDLDHLWKTFTEWADGMGLDRTTWGNPGIGFARRINKYLDVQKGAGGVHKYSKKGETIEHPRTITPEERKEFKAAEAAKKKVEEEIKRRSG